MSTNETLGLLKIVLAVLIVGVFAYRFGHRS